MAFTVALTEELALGLDVLWLAAGYMLLKTVIFVTVLRSVDKSGEKALFAVTAVLAAAAAAAAVALRHIPAVWARAQLSRAVLVSVVSIITAEILKALVTEPYGKYARGDKLNGDDYARLASAAVIATAATAFFAHEAYIFVKLLFRL